MNHQLCIVWSPENEIGIPIIDEQHRSIVSTINTFHYYAEQGITKGIVIATLKISEQYTKLHFQTEEELMQAAGFPGFEEHVKLHRSLAIRTRSIVSNTIVRKDVDEVLRFLKEWWMRHINSEDKSYAPYVKKLA